MERKAFTLSEVLITLGIIGVVAALTLPILIAKYQDMHFKVAYKKAYADANRAFRMIIANDEYLVPAGEYREDGVYITQNNGFGEAMKLLGKEFKTIRTCYNNDAENCFVLNSECGRTGQSSSYAFVDVSGRQWYMYSNNESAFIVDVNGSKEPNKLGKDRFVFQIPIMTNTNKFYEKREVVAPMFTQGFKNYADITVDENGDMTTPQRWCPSGKCYWTTWLLN